MSLTAKTKPSEFTLALVGPSRESAGLWQATVDSVAANIAVLDDEGVIVAVNQGWADFETDSGAARGTGDQSRGLGIGTDYLAVCQAASATEPLAREVRQAIIDVLAGRSDGYRTEYPCRVPGQERWFGMRVAGFDDAGTSGAVVIHQDITARWQAEHAVSAHAALLDAAGAALIAIDLEGLVTHWTVAAERLYGWSASEVIGRSVSEFTVGPEDQELGAAILQTVLENGRWEGRFDVRRKDGTQFPAYVRDTLLRDFEGQPRGFVGVSIDLSERVAMEQELRGTRDFLTTVTRTMPDGLYVLDADGRLSFINEAAEQMLGWTSDCLIGEIMHDVTHSQREDGSPLHIDDCPITHARETGTAVRVESDVFIRRDGSMLPVSYSAAPCELPAGGVGWVVVFNDIAERKEQEARLLRELEALDWVSRIRDALDEERFVLYAQPIVDLASGETVQHELLIRMLGEDGTVVAPGDFLPIAERFGLIREIDRYVIEHAMRYAADGHLVELNVSAASLSDEHLTEFVEHRLREHGVDPRLLVFEITETALVENESAAIDFVNRINALGCDVALDDFGSGYGSFHYLKRLPAQALKIDREFVADLEADPANRHVIDVTVRLAKALGKRTVAEGVEDEQTLETLKQLGVDQVQGYLFARPAPADDVFRMLSS